MAGLTGRVSSTLVFASMWAVGGVLVGTPTFLGLRRYVAFLEGLD